MSHKEGAEGALTQERGALLSRDVLTAAHAAVDLEVQRLAFLLGSGRETERKVYAYTHKMRAGSANLLSMAPNTQSLLNRALWPFPPPMPGIPSPSLPG